MKNKENKNVQEPIVEEVLSPDCDIDPSEFEWVGQDASRMQSITCLLYTSHMRIF